MIGCQSPEAEHDPGQWFGRIHAADLERVKDAAADYLTRKSDGFEVEHRILHHELGYRWVLCRGKAVFDGAGRPVRFAGSQTDVHERKLIEEQLAFDALHDALTGLPNRFLFLQRLQERLVAPGAGAGPRRCAVLILDLDRFTRVNDGEGRGAGDALLRVVAGRLLDCVGADDTVARLAGDEFALLLDEVEGGGAAGVVADRVLAALAQPFPLDDTTLFIGASVGIAVGADASAGDLLRQAEIALHRAKENGRGRWELFDAVMHRRAVDRLQTELDLRWALERDELALVYQPVVELGSRRPVGVEALVRWNHPTRGLVTPDAFIPIAEETGLILPLGDWVLRQVARELEGWKPARPLSVAVNLSVRQLRDPGLLRTLARMAPPPSSPVRLRLEITESALMEDPEASARLLRQIHSLGITLAIDDFGTGYSSLAYLLRLPLDALKIDRAFVRDLETRGESRQMVAAITELAHELDLEVVAEGVETEAQLEHLAALGVDQAQGFLFARPLPQAAVTPMLRG
jgi:diguanylate cyclase (GGDEF)-like protein